MIMTENKKYIYESPDKGKTIYRREFGKYDKRELINNNIEQLLEDLKDFYIWKVYANDDNFISNYLKNRDKTLANIPRSRMSK